MWLCLLYIWRLKCPSEVIDSSKTYSRLFLIMSPALVFLSQLNSSGSSSVAGFWVPWRQWLQNGVRKIFVFRILPCLFFSFYHCTTFNNLVCITEPTLVLFRKIQWVYVNESQFSFFKFSTITLLLQHHQFCLEKGCFSLMLFAVISVYRMSIFISARWLCSTLFLKRSLCSKWNKIIPYSNIGPAMQETPVQFLGPEDPLEKG